MAVLHGYDYLLGIGVVFAFLDAWNIGANDVANSFATSVASRSLTMLQAMLIASVMEFTGALGVGARVAETIRTKIIDPRLYNSDPAVLMLLMVCAVIASSLYLTLATKLGMPVSTTHSIVGGVIGGGVATVGFGRIDWSVKGVSSVFIAWVAAPGIAGAFASIIFLITKYGVMKRRNPVKWAFVSVPIYFFITGTLLAMLLIWKGASSKLNTLSEAEIAGAIVGTGAGVALIVILFFLPYLYRLIIKEDWTLKSWHIVYGPLLLKRGPVPEKPADLEFHQTNYYEGHLTADELAAKRAREAAGPVADADSISKEETDVGSQSSKHNVETKVTPAAQPRKVHKPLVGPKPEGKLLSGPVLFWWVKYLLLRGVDQDVVSLQTHGKADTILAGDLEAVHATTEHFDNGAEHMYSFLQVMTAATASFTHGANDVSNAIGPFATIYEIWSSGRVSTSSPVPLWILAFGGGAIVIGLWTYGYNIMRNLGNRITLHSPSRGFSMELGAAVTVIMATRLKIPVSTTQCIAGATVGVGLCSGNYRSINWRMVAWIYMGWFITVPVTALISGCLMGFIINAPQWGNSSG